MSFESEKEVQRKILAILKVLSNVQEPLGARIIAKNLKEMGIELSERGVRYHLKLTDERGLTQLLSDWDGRVITKKGLNEIDNAMVNDKVGFAISRIELLAFRTSFNYENRTGLIPVNVSFFNQDKLTDIITEIRPAFLSGLCVSNLVSIAESGQRIGELIVPEGNIGLATICSVVINGTLLKAGIPMDSRFGGLMQMRDHKPVRFSEIIHYDGSSLDPSEIFIKAKMTSIKEVTRYGSGHVLANFREIPAICRPVAEKVISGLNSVDINGVLVIGKTSEKVCEIDVETNKIGIILLGGLNPIAAAVEAGIEVENHSMSTLAEYGDLVNYDLAFKQYGNKYALSKRKNNKLK
jgi:HTH-type transcriptional regulator, global nitrogen regulator NrpRI